MTAASTDADRFTLGASLRRMGLLLFTMIAVLVLLMIFFEERFIFFPTAYDGGEAWHPLGIEYQDVDFHAADGTRLHGWYFPHPTPRAVVLFAHGNAGNIAGRTEVARRLHRLGASLLLFDYRGYGENPGSPSEEALAADARTMWDYVTVKRKVASDRVYVYGESLGGGVATRLAAEMCEGTITDLYIPKKK